MKKIPWPVIIVTMLLCACKKDNNNPNNQSTYLPKVYTEELRSPIIGDIKTTYNLTYDSKSRLISLVSVPDPPELKIIYQFQSDNQFTMDLYNSNTLSIHENIWLNSISMLDSTFQFNDTNDTSTEKYVYNGSKELIELREYDYHSTGNVLTQTTNYSYDVNGNLTQQSDDLGKTITFEYYPNLVNNLSMGQSYYYQSKNFVKTATSNDNGTIETATHYYTFDSNNRLTIDSAVTSGAADAIAIKTYTY